jgi:TM2 domain-containing membrane protein YozV
VDPDLEESCKRWYCQGKEAISLQDYGRGQICFREVLQRYARVENGNMGSLELVRLSHQALAFCYEKLDKMQEAIEQYKLLAELTEQGADKEDCAKNIARLEESLKVSSRDDRTSKVAPIEELSGKTPMSGAYKQQLLAMANKELPDGKRKGVATLLALTLGLFGVHRFYLGETVAGVIYLLLSFTFVPYAFAILDAINYMSMSMVTFNLQFNIEKVLALVPPAKVIGESTHMEVFSQEITDDPEDFIDELSTPRGG